MKASTSESLVKTVPKCRYYFTPHGCRHSSKCRFSHQAKRKEDETAVSGSASSANVEVDLSVPKNAECNKGSSVTEEEIKDNESENANDFQKKDRSKISGKKSRTFCHYFTRSGFCREGSKCRFLHPWHLVKSHTNSEKTKQVTGEGKPEENPGTDKLSGSEVKQSSKTGFQGRRPQILKLGKENVVESLSELTQESMKYLQKVEIDQLKKRFAQEDLEIKQHKSGTICKIKFMPSDPDWPYDVNEVQLSVTFPCDYPEKIFKAEIVNDGVFPNNFTKYINSDIEKHLQEHETAQHLRDTPDLLFRPFLRWLDRNIESLFTKSLKRIKLDAEAESAGLEFISFDTQDSKITSDAEKTTERDQSSAGDEIERHVQEKEILEEISHESKNSDLGAEATQTEKPSVMFEMVVSKNHVKLKKGTEVRFRGLELHENTATVRMTSLSFTVQCSRCKNKDDMPNVRENTQVVVTCTKCSNAQAILLTSSELVHQHSATLAYINPQGCSPLDLILSECEMSLGCLNCSKETSVKGIHYGSTKNVWCHHCHQKLDLKVDSTRFHQLQPANTNDANMTTVQVKKNVQKKDPLIKSGQPLPDNGTCKHYKKSFRWMRFPCCGKCYPCDRCHDEKEDHEMEQANRMICGFCAKEQPFSQKGCVSCKSFVTAVHTSHWEGGKGCRNKMKMSRNDNKKYSDMTKTVSKHATKVENLKKKK